MKTPTQKQKIAEYEKLLHNIQLYAEVTLNNDKVCKLIKNICSWSYAHRVGNGELSEKEQQIGINKCFYNLNNVT